MLMARAQPCLSSLRATRYLPSRLALLATLPPILSTRGIAAAGASNMCACGGCRQEGLLPRRPPPPSHRHHTRLPTTRLPTTRRASLADSGIVPDVVDRVSEAMAAELVVSYGGKAIEASLLMCSLLAVARAHLASSELGSLVAASLPGPTAPALPSPLLPAAERPAAAAGSRGAGALCQGQGRRRGRPVYLCDERP